MSNPLRPLRVTAHLEAGIAHAHDWGIALDGLLAGLIHSAAKAQLLAGGGNHTPLLEQEDPTDLDLPLARCEHGPQWHWAATCSWPIDGHQLQPQVLRWSGRHDHRVSTSLTRQLPRHVDDQRGRYRAHWMPLTVTTTSAVTFDAVGDLEQIRDLLQPVTAIGKKRAAGHGHVLSWTVTETDRSAWSAAHLHPNDTIGRPTPHACLEAPDAHAPHGATRTGPAGIRPPYSHPSRTRDLLLPAPAHHDQ